MINRKIFCKSGPWLCLRQLSMDSARDAANRQHVADAYWLWIDRSPLVCSSFYVSVVVQARAHRADRQTDGHPTVT